MITDPGGVAAAAANAERAPRAKVTVDWDNNGVAGVDDVSAQVGSVKVSRQISGDLPDEVTQVEGSSVAEATVELAVGDSTDNAKHAAWYFSRLNGASPLAGKERLSRPVTVDIGFDTSPGVTAYVRRFTGLSRSLPVSSTNRTATLTALDNRERLRTKVAVPAVTADVGSGSNVKPGLNAQWLVDYVLRANAFYASPARTGTVLSATMHGSATPDVGTLQWAGWYNSGAGTFDEPCRFAQGQFGYALAGPTVTAGHPDFYTWAGYRLSTPVALPNVLNDYVLLEWWGRIDPAVVGAPIRDLAVLYSSDAGSIVTLQLIDSAGVQTLQLTYDRGTSGATTVTTPLTATTYLSVSLRQRASGRRIEIRQNATTTTFDVADAGNIVDIAAADRAQMTAMGTVEGFLVTRGNTVTDVSPLTTYGWTAGAELGPSTNDLVAALPSDKRDSHELLRELAQAEFAWIGFTETGVAYYRTSEYWTRTAQQTVSHTIHADRDLLELAYSDNIDQVRNQISIPVNALTVTGVQDVWAADALSFPGRSVRSFNVTFDDPLVDLDTSVKSGMGNVPGFSRVRANTKPDGSGLDRSGYITVQVNSWTAGTAKLTVSNRYVAPLYLVDTSGNPALVLAGRQVIVSTRTATAAYEEDAPSIAAFGAQPLDVPDNQWRQDLSFCRGVAQALLSRLARPHITYTGIRVLGDPRRQLGDRARLVDPDGIAADVHVWITGCDDEHSPTDGYTQALSARQATTIAVWDVSFWDDGTVWGP